MTRQFLARRPIESLQHRSHMPEQLVARVEATQQESENILAQQPGFLGRLFPDEIQKARAAHELAQAQTEFEGRQRILRLVVETHVQGFQEVCNVLLAKCKVESRRGLANFLVGQMNLLQAEMEDHQANFQALMERKQRRIETITIPELKESEQVVLSNMIYDFTDLLDKMIQRYKSIANEFIETYDPQH